MNYEFGEKLTLSKKHKVIFLGYPHEFANPASFNTYKNGAVVIGKGYAQGILVRQSQLTKGWG